MKIRLTILIVICIATFLFACKKENRIERKDLYRKWILIEMHDTYRHGATSSWHSVSNDELHFLEFTSAGGFKRTESTNAAFQECNGTYRLLAEDKIEVRSNCQPAIERMTVSELTSENLIIDFIGTEGVIRYKYRADK